MEVATMTDLIKAEMAGIENQKKFHKLIESIRWSERGKAELLDILLETYEMSPADAVKEALDGPYSEEAMELIQSESNRWKGFWHG
mgnify:FL=1|jgi:hypothetical protein